MNTDTPRTDAELESTAFENKNHPHTDWVMATFARQLERELNAAAAMVVEQLNQNERLLSLVRLQRYELHQQGAISDKEYADLVKRPELRAALETHDDLKDEVKRLRKALEIAEKDGYRSSSRETMEEYNRLKA